MRRIAAIYAFFAVAAASYDNPSDPSPDAVQAFNPSHAPDPVCRANEEYSQCATHCEPTCTNPNPVCIRSCAPAQCQCVYGYVRNEYGECVANNACAPATYTTEAPVEETTTTTTTEAYTTEAAPVYTEETTTAAPATYETTTAAPATYETTTAAPATYETTPPYYNAPAETTAYEEPTTTTEAYQYATAPTDAPVAPVDTAYTPDETPVAEASTDSTPEATAAPSSSDYAPSAPASQNQDAAPVHEDDEDTVIVGGACGENTCRVGFKCDDSTAVGAKCIPYDTRSRSSCAAIRCRPGWSCVIAMDGPRCYRNSVLGYADAAPEPTAAPAPSASDYAADPAVPAETPSGKTCADVICPFGLTCFEGGIPSSDAFCRSSTEGRESAAQLCTDVQCGPNEACTDNHNGPVCEKNAPATCAATSCVAGTACIESPEGAKCELPQGGPQVFPGKTCATNVCPDLHQCFDTVDGASCYPIPTDPVEPVVEPVEPEPTAAPVEEDPAKYLPMEDPTDNEPLARAESSDPCERTTCGSGQHCAIDFEGTAYCRTIVGENAVADVPTASSDPTIPVPLCSQITCPSEHECFDDSVKGAACWPVKKDAKAAAESAPESPSCRTHSCHPADICVEEGTGPRCVPAQRRGVTAPGYRRRF